MKCPNCGKKIPDAAAVCQFCELAVGSEPTAAEIAMVEEMLTQMDPEMIQELQTAFEESGTAEEFANRLLVGDCPKCGSHETGNCGSDPEIDDPSVGRCFKCGQLWCTFCDKLLEKSSPVCTDCEEMWDEQEDWEDDEKDE
jgi:hypothetical protein